MSVHISSLGVTAGAEVPDWSSIELAGTELLREENDMKVSWIAPGMVCSIAASLHTLKDRHVVSRLCSLLDVSMALVAGLITWPAIANAQISYEVLHAFAGGTDGAIPLAGLIQASDGNFYGTTSAGGGSGCGGSGCGTVFQMTLDGTATVLYSFTGGVDGAVRSAALIQASDGNFYGTTSAGGGSGCGGSGCGTVFEMTLDGTVTTLYSFSGDADGAKPF